MKLYFAYGANLNINSMGYRCPDAVAVQPFLLRGWRLAFSGVATIQPDPDGCVAGALWAISEEDERNLDIFEGYPTLYHKKNIVAEGLEFMVYAMNSSRPCEPSAGYLMTIVQGYQDWGLDLDQLTEVVERTEKEVYHYDLYRSTGTKPNGSIGSLESDLYMESSDDVRWLRDIWHSGQHTSTLE